MKIKQSVIIRLICVIRVLFFSSSGLAVGHFGHVSRKLHISKLRQMRQVLLHAAIFEIAYVGFSDLYLSLFLP